MITATELQLMLDNFLIKYFIILLSTIIVLYFINKISYRKD